MSDGSEDYQTPDEEDFSLNNEAVIELIDSIPSSTVIDEPFEVPDMVQECTRFRQNKTLFTHVKRVLFCLYLEHS